MGTRRGVRALRLQTAAAIAVCLVAFGPDALPAALRDAAPATATGAPRLPRLHRVAVLVLENREYRRVIGSPHAPYLNALARRYSLATRYYAIGHPSLPNYMALTGGSTFEIRHDCNGCDSEAPNLISQLDQAGISWKSYFESLPRPGFLGTRSYRYTKHLNPFVYYRSITRSAADRSRIVPMTRLGRDLRRHRLPRLLWIAPNLCHDSHYCSVRASDRFAAKLVPRLLRRLGPSDVLFVTWDEGTTRRGAHGRPGGGHIALIAAGGAARRHARISTVANHYSLLRTIETGLGLDPLGQAGAPSTPLLGSLLTR
jgi:phosphatidylinositol-3-phosphatase